MLDARSVFHYIATGFTPAMAHARAGAGSAYAYTLQDANGDHFDVARTYRLRMESNPPAENFWAVNIYDTQTRSLLIVPFTPYPALASDTGDLVANEDGSYVYFGPTFPGRSRVALDQALPGKSWFPIVRLYGPLEPWFDQT